MPLDRDEILLDNLRESFDTYQRAVFWSMTASSAFFLLTLRLRDSATFRVAVLYGELTGPVAWFITLLLFLLLGGYASSAIRKAEHLLEELHPEGACARQSWIHHPWLPHRIRSIA